MDTYGNYIEELLIEETHIEEELANFETQLDHF
jgi:hypothetical protein